MHFSFLLLGASIFFRAATAQAPFSNVTTSSSTSVTGPSTFSPVATPPGTVAVFKLSIQGRTGGFQCRENVGVFFNTAITAAQGSQFNLEVDGSLTCSTGTTTISIFNIFVQAQGTLAKRQTSAELYSIGVGTSVPAAAFTTTFNNAGGVLGLSNGGSTFNFALSATGLLVAFRAGSTLPAGITAITILTISSNGAIASTTGPTSGTSASQTAVQTATTTIVSIVNNVRVSVNVIIVVVPLSTAQSFAAAVAVTINGALFRFTSTISVATLITYRSIAGVLVTSGTAVVIVNVVSVVIPATQVIVLNGRTTTLSGVVTTTGTFTSSQVASGAVTRTTTITVAPRTTVTATRTTVTITAGAAVVVSRVVTVATTTNAKARTTTVGTAAVGATESRTTAAGVRATTSRSTTAAAARATTSRGTTAAGPRATTSRSTTAAAARNSAARTTTAALPAITRVPASSGTSNSKASVQNVLGAVAMVVLASLAF